MQVVRAGYYLKRLDGYLTEEATLKANGAWNAVEAETNNTDCAASTVGPRLVQR